MRTTHISKVAMVWVWVRPRCLASTLLALAAFSPDIAMSSQLFAARFCSYNTGDGSISVAIPTRFGERRTQTIAVVK
jgi:hypothetical protein